MNIMITIIILIKTTNANHNTNHNTDAPELPDAGRAAAVHQLPPVQALAWLSLPFWPFSVSRLAVLPFWIYACLILPLELASARPSKRKTKVAKRFVG